MRLECADKAGCTCFSFSPALTTASLLASTKVMHACRASHKLSWRGIRRTPSQRPTRKLKPSGPMAGVMEGPGGAGLRQTGAEAGPLRVSLETKVPLISNSDFCALTSNSAVHRSLPATQQHVTKITLVQHHSTVTVAGCWVPLMLASTC